MENKKRKQNILIGGLLAIVFIMAVGFAGFTQLLQINETSSVTSDWDISIKSITPSVSCEGAVTTDCGSIGSFVANSLEATLETSLSSPGRTVSYTIVVENRGGINAELSAFVTSNDGINYNTIVTSNGALTGTNATSVIDYSLSGYGDITSLPASSTKTFTVTVTFNAGETGAIAPTDAKASNSLKFRLNYAQAA